MMSTPPIRRNESWCSRRNCPATVAVAPSATNTSEKPRMKAREWMIVRRRTRGAALAEVSSSNETPVMKVTYEGTSGSTHGEMNETTRSEEHTSELQSPYDLVCRLLLEKKNE